MHILILIGSSHKNSHSLHLGETIAAYLEEKGAATTLLDLVEYALPPFDRSIDLSKEYDVKTAHFLEQTRAADAYVWVTPVYHNSYSSILKNALDWQHFPLHDKAVGLASNGGHRAPMAIDHLMIVARSMRLISSPVRVCTAKEDYDDTLAIVSEPILERIATFGDTLLSLAQKLSTTESI